MLSHIHIYLSITLYIIFYTHIHLARSRPTLRSLKLKTVHVYKKEGGMTFLFDIKILEVLSFPPLHRIKQPIPMRPYGPARNFKEGPGRQLVGLLRSSQAAGSMAKCRAKIQAKS